MPEPKEARILSPREALSDLFESGTYNQIKNLLDSLRPADIAALLESSPPKERTIIWNLIPDDEQSEILQQVGDPSASRPRRYS